MDYPLPWDGRELTPEELGQVEEITKREERVQKAQQALRSEAAIHGLRIEEFVRNNLDHPKILEFKQAVIALEMVLPPIVL